MSNLGDATLSLEDIQASNPVYVPVLKPKNDVTIGNPTLPCLPVDPGFMGGTKNFLRLCSCLKWVLNRHHNHGGVTEIRILKDSAVWKGYFDKDHLKELIASLLPLSKTPRIKIPFSDYPRIGEASFYFCSHPAIPALIARSANKFTSGRPTTGDNDIISYDLFFIDFDSVRPVGISSTDEEKRASLRVCRRVKKWFKKRGISCCICDSGNGWHILIPTIPYTDIESTKKKTNLLLHLLDREFSSPEAKIDTTVGNASRICKLYGSKAIVGSSTLDRPHRWSAINVKSLPAEVDLFEMLESDLSTPEEKQTCPTILVTINKKGSNYSHSVKNADNKGNAYSWDQPTSKQILETVLTCGGFKYRVANKEGREILSFENCPYHIDNDGHKYECSVIVEPNGSFSAHCFHNDEAGWKDFKEVIGWRGNIRKVLADLGIKKYTKQEIAETPIHADISDNFILEISQKTPLRYWRDDWWLYDGRRYVKRGGHEVDAIVTRFLASNEFTRKYSTVNFRGSVIENMKSTVIIPDLVEMPSWLNDSERNGNYIVLQNGIIHLESLIYNKEGSFLKHSSEYFSGNLLPYEYIPNARCEKWMDFLNEVQPDPIIQGLLQEFFGYCLIHDTSLHKFLLLTGEGANGKSVLCSTLSSVLGYENVSTISLEMFNGRYSLIATLGKLANVVSEIGEIDKSAEGYLKAFVSGDRMPFEQKYKPVFTAKPTARLVFATNTLPRFVDKSEGLWRRMLIVPFNVVIAEEKQKVSLEDELRMELPGILNWALTGLIRLRERGKFIQPDASKTAKTEYQLEMNPAKAFLQDCCEVDVQSEVLIGNIYYAYNEYCKNGGFIAMNSANFGKEILRAFPNCKKQRKRVNGVKVAFYMGIRLSEALCVNPEPEFTPEMMTELDSWT